ncbi:MAG: pilin, partial [bacterium]|nr:pilin [bacterium]
QLSWSATSNSCAPTTCAITGGGLNRTGLSYQGNISTGNLTSTQNYTLTCTNSGGQDTQSATVTVGTAPAPTLNLQANGASQASIGYGGSVTLTWSSTNATSCEASSTSDKWTGTRLPNGSSMIYNLTSDESFTLTCTGPGGTASGNTVTVTVGNAPEVTLSLTAKPAAESDYSNDDEIEVGCGTAVDIRWEVTGATNCDAYGNWSGPKSTTGGTYRTQGLINTEGYYYEIFCYNAENDNQTDTIFVTVRECTGNEPIVFTNPIEQGDLGGILDSVSGLIKMIAIGLAGIMIIVSGIIILTSIDDRERLNKGKRMLKWSLIGLAIALASSFIIGFIEELVT